ncbi:MAG: acyl--CoA ligase, partial [Minwuiales bacterium]|nr:acyl--CoA ligase [Minwuiales bacterium]
IRNREERRRFRTGHYHRLNDLGGGRRFRADRFTPHMDHFRFSEDALDLRAAMAFDPDRVRHYVEAGWWRDDTLSGWLDRHADASPDNPAIRTADATIAYGDLAERVARLAGGLSRAGVRRGDVVGVQLPNIPEYLIAYLAIARLGAVMTTVYMPYRAAEMETLLGHSRARAFICMSDAGGFAAATAALSLKPNLPALEAVIALGEPVPGALSLADLMAEEPIESDDGPVASDPFLLLYTSGTTDRPKAVPLSYHNMLGNARFGLAEHRIAADDLLLSAAPFGHLFGLYSVHLALAAGACSLLLPTFSPPALAQLIEAARPTVLFTAPAHVAACLAGGLFDAHDIASLRLTIMSGSAVPADLARVFAERLGDGRVSQLWGMTETQAGLYTRPDDPIDVAAASAGRPSPGTEVRIGDEDELQVRGPLLFPGYFNNPEANRAAFTDDGWFRTGDTATIDDAGNVAITGRLKDIINRGGVKYNPRDIEELLDRHPKILQSAIVPVPDPVLGEKACCFAVAAEGDAPTLDELCAYLAEHDIAKHKLPERLELVAEMPMTATRKIIKARLKPAGP